MHKSFLLLLATLLANVVLAQINTVIITNNDASRGKKLEVPVGLRYCYCLSQTQTAEIDGRYAGQVKLFSTSDCTGNFAIGSEKITKNAQWVNSISFGRAGIPSTWGGGRTCKHY